MANQNQKNQQHTEEFLESDYLTPPTREVLQKRLDHVGIPQFFDAGSFQLLSIVCDLLMDQDSKERIVEIAIFIDGRLFKNISDGWRYDCLPPDRMLYQQGLKNIEASSKKQYQKEFLELQKPQHLELLSNIQKGNVDDEIWKNINPMLFFEEVLAEATAIFFSHPIVQTRIHYVGMADAKGWTKLKLNEVEKPETDITN